MIDESRLREAMAALGDRLPGPGAGARDRLLAAAPEWSAAGRGGARGTPAGSSRRWPRWPLTRRQTGLAVAAVIVLAAVAAGALGAANRTGGTASSGNAGSAASAVPRPASSAPAGAYPPLPARAGAHNRAVPAPAAGPSTTLSPQKTVSGSPGQANLVPGAAEPAKVVETGSVDLGYPKGSFGQVVDRLGALAGGSGGFVANQQASRSGGAPTGTVTLRVPVASFENVLHQVESMGSVRSETTSGRDVTGQYVDLGARIAALEATRSQLTAILARSATVSDTLAVEGQIQDVQSQLDQLKGQQQLVANQADFSTLTVTLSQAGSPAPGPARGGLGQAWHTALSGFVGGFETVLAGSGTVAAALISLGVGLLVVGGLARLAWTTMRRWRL